jgi:hypothetical protein
LAWVFDVLADEKIKKMKNLLGLKIFLFLVFLSCSCALVYLFLYGRDVIYASGGISNKLPAMMGSLALIAGMSLYLFAKAFSSQKTKS